jgi:hypothetical protein
MNLISRGRSRHLSSCILTIRSFAKFSCIILPLDPEFVCPGRVGFRGVKKAVFRLFCGLLLEAPPFPAMRLNNPEGGHLALCVGFVIEKRLKVYTIETLTTPGV